MRLSYFTLPLILIISGCSGDVQTVQEATAPFDQSLTVEQAFDNRDVCSDIAWDEFEDDKGRNIIEYKCFINESDEYFNELKEKQERISEARYKKLLNASTEVAEQQRDSDRKEIEDKYNLTSAYESVRWTINSNNTPILSSAKIIIIKDDDSEISQKLSAKAYYSFMKTSGGEISNAREHFPLKVVLSQKLGLRD